MLKVCIADDHLLILNAVEAALRAADDIELVGKAQSGDELIGLVEAHSPNVVLLDRRMPGNEGLACLKTIKARWPEVHVVMLSTTEDPKEIAEALDAGASAYIGKRIGPADLASALRHVALGVVYQRSAGSDDDEATAAAAPGEDLTQRERAMLEAVARGLSTKAISRELWVTEKTVKFHLTNIYRKLGVHNRTGAMRYAFEHGLVPSPSVSQEDDAVSA